MTYTKTINGRQVFSSCRVITLNGADISNPTEDQIREAGWVEYVPPAVIPQPQTEPGYDQLMTAIKKMLAHEAENLSDEEALEVAALYPTWISKVGDMVILGERLGYNEKLYKVIQTHTAQSDWTPDVSSALFTEVSIVEGPDFVSPTGREDSYMIGDKITFEGKHYVCTMDYNVYSPADYPAGWREE